jgi:tripartite-type tricarboxylate transporter receptor subunit TctC
MKRRQALIATSASLLTMPQFVAAQETFPTKPIRIIVPFSAGGPVDAVARLVGEAIGKNLGQPVLIENRTGGAGIIGSEYVASQPADGYTLLMGNNTTHTLPAVFKTRPSYTPNTMFAPIGLVGFAQTVLVVSNKLPITDYASFIKYARANPGKLSYASSGNGSGSHIAAEWFKDETKTFMVHIPYRGTGQAMTDLIAGQIDMMFDSVISAMPQVQAGRVKVLAVASRSPIPGQKDLKTLQELGIRNFDASMWLGLYAPARTPAPAIQRLNDSLDKVLRDPQISGRLSRAGIAVGGGTPATLATYTQIMEAITGNIVRTRNIKPE